MKKTKWIGKVGIVQDKHYRPKFQTKTIHGLVLIGREIETVVCVQVFESPSVTSACVYVNGPTWETEGSASAGGYQYDLTADCIHNAFKAAGFHMEHKDHRMNVDKMIKAVLNATYPRHKVKRVI